MPQPQTMGELQWPMPCCHQRCRHDGNVHFNSASVLIIGGCNETKWRNTSNADLDQCDTYWLELAVRGSTKRVQLHRVCKNFLRNLDKRDAERDATVEQFTSQRHAKSGTKRN